HEFSKTAISPDSRWIVTEDPSQRVQAWDLAAGQRVTNPQISEELRAGISENTLRYSWVFPGVPTWKRGDLYVEQGRWNVIQRNRKAIQHSLPSQPNKVTKLASSPDGRWVITAIREIVETREEPNRLDDNMVLLWDLEANDPTLSPLIVAGHQGEITSVAI